MKISEVIQKMKKYHRGIAQGKPIDDATTRDQILYGNPVFLFSADRREQG